MSTKIEWKEDQTLNLDSLVHVKNMEKDLVSEIDSLRSINNLAKTSQAINDGETKTINNISISSGLITKTDGIAISMYDKGPTFYKVCDLFGVTSDSPYKYFRFDGTVAFGIKGQNNPASRFTKFYIKLSSEETYYNILQCKIDSYFIQYPQTEFPYGIWICKIYTPFPIFITKGTCALYVTYSQYNSYDGTIEMHFVDPNNKDYSTFDDNANKLIRDRVFYFN